MNGDKDRLNSSRCQDDWFQLRVAGAFLHLPNLYRSRQVLHRKTFGRGARVTIDDRTFRCEAYPARQFGQYQSLPLLDTTQVPDGHLIWVSKRYVYIGKELDKKIRWQSNAGVRKLSVKADLSKTALDISHRRRIMDILRLYRRWLLWWSKEFSQNDKLSDIGNMSFITSAARMQIANSAILLAYNPSWEIILIRSVPISTWYIGHFVGR